MGSFRKPILLVNWCLKLKHLCHGENSEDIQFIKVSEICARSDSAELEMEIDVKDEKIDSISEEESEIEVDGEYSEVEVNYTVCESVHSNNSDCQQSVCEEDNFKVLPKRTYIKIVKKLRFLKNFRRKQKRKCKKIKLTF